MSALKEEYLEPTTSDENSRYLRVTHLKGDRLLDGVPFVRVGLWRAWYEEHGWLIAVFVGGFGVGLGAVIRRALALLSSKIN